MTKPMKIVILEPSDIIREGVRSILLKINENFRLSRTEDPVNLISYLQREEPDVLIVNPCVPGLKHPNEIKQESRLENLICIALLTSLETFRLQTEYDASISILDEFEQIRDKMVKLSPRKTEPEGEKNLSQREKEIVAYIAKGYTNKQIADALCLSSHTVITHRRNIASKLQIHSPAGLTIYAVVNKLVKLEEIKD